MELRDAGAQVLVLSLVCFCCPGLFNALSSIASGLSDPAVAYAGNAVVCACFASSSLVASSLLARAALSVRSSLVVGTVGYILYSASLARLSLTGSPSTLELRLYYAACAALGLSAGFLWSAQGLIIMSYATKATQGQFLSRFWVIFNLGAVAGGLISFFLSVGSASDVLDRPSSPAMYAAFLILMCAGCVLAGCCILQPKHVVKSDGTPVEPVGAAVVYASGSSASLRGIRGGDHVDRSLAAGKVAAVCCLLPLFAYSNWFYTYHSLFNVSVFNARTSGLSCACYWLTQMVAAHVCGSSLDRHVRQLDAVDRGLGGRQFMNEQQQSTTEDTGGTFPAQLHRQHVRIIATRSLIQLAVLSNVMWVIGWYFQASTSFVSYGNTERLDVTADFWDCIAPFLLYMFYGWHDAQCQVWVYWFLGSMADRDPAFCAQLAGIYKSVQAVSASASWLIGAIEMDPLRQLTINWCLCNAALIGAWFAVGTLARALFTSKRQAIDELHPLIS